MKPISHDPLDDLIAAALHGDLTPAERTQFETRLANDPAARAAYQEALLMHDLLEKTHANAQPDPNFEQRMVSGVRRKLADAQRPRETAWESFVILWTGLGRFFRARRITSFAMMIGILAVLAGLSLGPITRSLKSAKQNAAIMQAREEEQGQLEAAKQSQQQVVDKSFPTYDAVASTTPAAPDMPPAASTPAQVMGGNGVAISAGTMTLGANSSVSGANTYTGGTTVVGGGVITNGGTVSGEVDNSSAPAPVAGTFTVHAGAGTLAMGSATLAPVTAPQNAPAATGMVESAAQPAAEKASSMYGVPVFRTRAISDYTTVTDGQTSVNGVISENQKKDLNANPDMIAPMARPSPDATPSDRVGQLPGTTPQGGTIRGSGFVPPGPTTAPADTDLSRKLIRNAELELEVKSFQAAMDQIAALTRTAGGYVDSDNSQRGGNGKLQGTVVVKVLPQNLDDFLLKLRDLGELKNQTISTEDVTKEYVDTQARLDNSRRMETQLQELLKRDTSRVSDLLMVERELGRVRGEIEQMQGQLKLYDFQVEYATVTMQIREKDLNQAAAYLLKEQDNFSLLAPDVEAAFQQARRAADDFKAQVLTANLNHNSGSDGSEVSAQLDVMVPPDQIEPFLAQIRTVGHVTTFTRQTQRVARDGGDSDQPADQTLTEKDKVDVQIAIGSDDASRKQIALTVVTPAVDDALDQAKSAALASAGTEILGSSLNKTPEGQSTAQLSLRVPGKNYRALLDAFRALGRTASFSLQRDDNSGPGTSGDDEPVILNLSLTDDETPLQETQLAVLGQDVDNQAQQLKQDAAAAGVEIKASSFQRQPSGIEIAQMTFRLPMAKYPAFIESLKKLGKVEMLAVSRNDQPDQVRTDDSAPAQIDLTLHSQGDIVADNSGLWATLRQTFSDGAGALFGSVRVIGVAVAFIVPWLIALVLVVWMGRRVYVWYKK